MENGKNVNLIAVLLDLENVAFNHVWMTGPEKFSIKAGFEKLLAWLQGIGKVAMFCIFFPTHFIQKGRLSEADMEYFQEKGFFPIICPKIGPERKDTTDTTLIKWGLEVLLPHMCGITHLCVGSGDIDFIWLQMEAEKKGLKLMVVAGAPESLSSQVRKKADVDSKTGEPMIHYFDPNNNSE